MTRWLRLRRKQPAPQEPDPPPPPIGDPRRFDLFYEEIGRVTAVFWEWRHKVILLSVASLGGMLAIAAWLYERSLGRVLCIPFLVGAAVFFLCWKLERRIALVLADSYKRGGAFERSAATAPRGADAERDNELQVIGIYEQTFATRGGTRMRADDPAAGSFTRILWVTYTLLCGLSTIAGVALLVIAICHAGSLMPRR